MWYAQALTESFFGSDLVPVWSRRAALLARSLSSISQCSLNHATPQVSNQEDTPKGPLMLDHPIYQWPFLLTGTSTIWCFDTQYA